MAAKWVLVNQDKIYRDYEPSEGIEIEGYSIISLNDIDHIAYAHKVNPAAATDDNEPTYTDEVESITWERAHELVSREW